MTLFFAIPTGLFTIRNDLTTLSSQVWIFSEREFSCSSKYDSGNTCSDQEHVKHFHASNTGIYLKALFQITFSLW